MQPFNQFPQYAGQQYPQQPMMPQQMYQMPQQYGQPPMQYQQQYPNQLAFLPGSMMMGGMTPEQMQLKAYFAQACADGMIQVAEVQNACAICGVRIDPATAQQLLLQVAGADRRITEQEFVVGISTYCNAQKQRFMQQQQQQQQQMMMQQMMMPRM
ncbi:hypothetical protein PAPYR_4211 [Paratrimastix pyriformis]|uniref:Uncharacterized protein n=1 Tax=Paratrimastix pyriformis TaxID=342808 RepID=A0ABQ8UQ28_9EUKA|nr:hypothetical protein PAPYR_4211 [Paratrimastix pyriformis]